MADTWATETRAAYRPAPRAEGESLFKHVFDNMRDNAMNAGENIYDPRTVAFVSFVTSDSFISSFISHGGNVDNAVAFAQLGHEKRAEMDSLGLNIDLYDGFADDIYAALDADNAPAVDDLIVRTVAASVVGAEEPEVAPETVLASAAVAAPDVSEVEAPAATILPAQGATFWNAYTNVKSQIADGGNLGQYDYYRELLTYVQADERYPAYVDSYLESATGMDDAEKAALREEARLTHEESVRVLDETDGFSTTVFAASQDFYSGIELAVREQPVPVEVASISPDAIEAPVAPVFDESIATRILGEELTAAPDVPVTIITEPSAPEVLPEQIDKYAFNAEMVEAQAEAAALAEITPDAAPVVDVSVPAPAEPEAPASMDYEIQQGDTLSQIVAEHYGLTKWADIQRVYETVARNNGIEDPDKIYTGNNLVLFDDPTVDLHPEGTEVCSDLNAAFCRAVDGTTLAANSPDAPVVRPQLRPEGLAPAA